MFKWKTIETAPKDGTYILVGNRYGAWVATYCDRFQSGFVPQNPWQSVMLNHRHMERRDRPYSLTPSHWMPLPLIPLDSNVEKDTHSKCTNSDTWNCKYCDKIETCAALSDPRNHGKPDIGK
jgi:hypothetical protein